MKTSLDAKTVVVNEAALEVQIEDLEPIVAPGVATSPGPIRRS